MASSQAAKIDSQGTSALPDQLRKRLRPADYRSSCEYQAIVKQVSDLRGQRGQLIAVEPQLLEAGELADLRWQRGQLIAVERQRLEAGELADLRWQRGQLIAVEPQRSGGW